MKILSLVLLVFFTINCSEVRGQPTDTHMSYQQALEVFPIRIAYKIQNNTFFLSRCINIFEYGHKEKMSLPENGEENFNNFYLNFLKTNDFRFFSNGIQLHFIDNSFWIGDQKADIASTNIFEEGFRYVVDENFNVYISDKAGNHQSILNGQYVLCAGILKFDENGKIAYIDNSTGHYLSDQYQLQTIIRYFLNAGMLAEDAYISVWDKGKLVDNVHEFIQLELEKPETNKLIHSEPSEELESKLEIYNRDPKQTNFSTEANSLAFKIHKVLYHLNFLRRRANPSEKEFQEYALMEKPFPDLYDDVRKIEELSRLFWRLKAIDNGHYGHIFNPTNDQILEIKRSAYKEIQNFISGNEINWDLSKKLLCRDIQEYAQIASEVEQSYQ